jgi:hypothetical protein
MESKAIRARRLTAFFFVLGGALFTSIAIFFVAGFLLTIILGTHIPTGIIGDSYLTFSFGLGPIIGGIIGYLVFKKSKYSDPTLYTEYYKQQ